jgi:hypothetical protein
MNTLRERANFTVGEWLGYFCLMLLNVEPETLYIKGIFFF